MIVIKEKPKKDKKTIPHYQLRFSYMIGDADGNTNEKSTVSLENPYLERFVSFLNKVDTPDGRWGLSLDKECFNALLKQKKISEDDYDFVMKMFGDRSKFVIPRGYEKYVSELSRCVRSQTEYSYLTFEGGDIFYFDEFGEKYETEIIPD